MNKKTAQLLSLKKSIDVLERFKVSRIPELEISPRIPKVIFQYWDRNPPNQIISLLERNRFLCQANNIKYVLFNDEDARNCLKEHFAEDVYRAYDLSPHPAMKCDLFRLCYLYQYGGFYLDADMVLTEKFCELFSIKGELAAFKWNNGKIKNICNWLIGSEANSPIIKFALDGTTHSILKACNHTDNVLKNILSISGPGIFTRTISTYIFQKEKQHKEFYELAISIESVDYAYTLVQNGPKFLKKPLKYKKTKLHWLTAEKTRSNIFQNAYLKIFSNNFHKLKLWKK